MVPEALKDIATLNVDEVPVPVSRSTDRVIFLLCLRTDTRFVLALVRQLFAAIGLATLWLSPKLRWTPLSTHYF